MRGDALDKIVKKVVALPSIESIDKSFDNVNNNFFAYFSAHDEESFLSANNYKFGLHAAVDVCIMFFFLLV
jgi:hypothetical protein